MGEIFSMNTKVMVSIDFYFSICTCLHIYILFAYTHTRTRIEKTNVLYLRATSMKSHHHHQWHRRRHRHHRTSWATCYSTRAWKTTATMISMMFTMLKTTMRAGYVAKGVKLYDLRWPLGCRISACKWVNTHTCTCACVCVMNVIAQMRNSHAPRHRMA